MATYPPTLLITADELAERARTLFAEVIELADAYDATGWESQGLPGDVEGSDDEDRYLATMHVASTALCAMWARLGQHVDGTGMPTPAVVERYFPGVLPSYSRLFKAWHAEQARWYESWRVEHPVEAADLDELWDMMMNLPPEVVDPLGLDDEE